MAQPALPLPALPRAPWPPDARCIVHMDLDCFYASVEVLLDSSLHGKPLAVVMGLDAQGHGVVATASYPARAFGARTAARLRDQGTRTLGERAAVDAAELVPAFGSRRAMDLHRGALGLDDSPLRTERRAVSISAEQTLGRGESDPRRLWALYREMAADVAHRLQHEGLVARTVGIKL